jgi:hypothetical protein
LKVQEYSERVAKDAVSYLDKYSPVLSGPHDVMELFSKVKVAKRIKDFEAVLAKRKKTATLWKPKE